MGQAWQVIVTIGKMMKVGQNRRMFAFDFERQLFYSSPEVEKAERGRYYQTLDDFETYAGRWQLPPMACCMHSSSTIQCWWNSCAITPTITCATP